MALQFHTDDGLLTREQLQELNTPIRIYFIVSDTETTNISCEVSFPTTEGEGPIETLVCPFYRSLGGFYYYSCTYKLLVFHYLTGEDPGPGGPDGDDDWLTMDLAEVVSYNSSTMGGHTKISVTNLTATNQPQELIDEVENANSNQSITIGIEVYITRKGYSGSLLDITHNGWDETNAFGASTSFVDPNYLLAMGDYNPTNHLNVEFSDLNTMGNNTLDNWMGHDEIELSFLIYKMNQGTATSLYEKSFPLQYEQPTPTPDQDPTGYPATIYVTNISVDSGNSNVTGEYTLKPAKYFNMQYETLKYYENDYGYMIWLDASSDSTHIFVNSGGYNYSYNNDKQLFNDDGAVWEGPGGEIVVCEQLPCEAPTPTPFDICDNYGTDGFYVKATDNNYGYLEGFYSFSNNVLLGDATSGKTMTYNKTGNSSHSLMHNFYTSSQGHLHGWGLYSYGSPASSRTPECASATSLGTVSYGIEVTWCSPTGNSEPTPENYNGSICGN